MIYLPGTETPCLTRRPLAPQPGGGQCSVVSSRGGPFSPPSLHDVDSASLSLSLSLSLSPVLFLNVFFFPRHFALNGPPFFAAPLLVVRLGIIGAVKNATLKLELSSLLLPSPSQYLLCFAPTQLTSVLMRGKFPSPSAASGNSASLISLLSPPRDEQRKQSHLPCRISRRP